MIAQVQCCVYRFSTPSRGFGFWYWSSGAYRINILMMVWFGKVDVRDVCEHIVLRAASLHPPPTHSWPLTQARAPAFRQPITEKEFCWDIGIHQSHLISPSSYSFSASHSAYSTSQSRSGILLGDLFQPIPFFTLKGQCHEIFDPRFFRQSITPGPWLIP
jgi:hypothetical protein